MNKALAIQLLGLQEPFGEEDVEDAFKAEVFKIKDFVLRNAPVPMLLQKRLALMQNMGEAKCVLTEQEFSSSENVGEKSEVFFEESWTITEIIRLYEKKLSAKKLKVAQHFDVQKLSAALGDLIEIQAAYEDCITRKYETLASELLSRIGAFDFSEVKISKPMYTQEFLQASLKVEAVKGNETGCFGEEWLRNWILEVRRCEMSIQKHKNRL